MEGVETFDETVSRLFHTSCGNQYLSRREVVESAKAVFPRCGPVVGRLFDAYYDGAQVGTCRMHDLARGLSQLLLGTSQLALQGRLEEVDEEGGSWAGLTWLWDEELQRPALARTMNEAKRRRGQKKDYLLLLLSLQWVKELGEALPEVETFENQVGGHKGDAEMKAAGGTIMKPLNMQEVRRKKKENKSVADSLQWLFYENLELLTSKELIPPGLFARFFGRTRLPDADGSGGWSDWLVLENLCQEMKHPSILDLKIGASSMGQTKSGAVKKVKQAVVKAMSTSSSLGFRVAGMKVYHPAKTGHETKPKKYGMSLTKATVHTAFQDFLSPDGIWQPALARPLLGELERIRTFFLTQMYFSFNSSSLLVLYDAGGALIVRLIDFAHCFPLPGTDNALGFVSCAPLSPHPVPPILPTLGNLK